jgi:hypothetical protein
LREHIPNTGQKLEDVFVGKALVVMFNGDRERILADTARELGGESFAGRKDAGHVDPDTPLGDDQFQMMVAVLDDDYRLNPRDAVSMLTGDLCALAGKPLSDSTMASEPVYVPRIPIDATEADAIPLAPIPTNGLPICACSNGRGFSTPRKDRLASQPCSNNGESR